MATHIDLSYCRSAVESLLGRRLHSALAGYLAVCEQSTRDGRTTALQPDFKDFFDRYLAVSGGPKGKPYYRPFWHQQSSRTKAWYQANVAGTFSPRSALRLEPFVACISVDVDNGTFTLRPDHACLVRQHLAYCEPVEVLDAAVFLLRDYEFSDSTVTTESLISEFAARFAFRERAKLEPLFRLPALGADLPDIFVRS